MRRTAAPPEVPCLSRFAAERPEADWEAFRDASTRAPEPDGRSCLDHVRQALRAAQGGLCAWCEREIGLARGDTSVDHLHPQVMGEGRLALDNLLACCDGLTGALPPGVRRGRGCCNASKGSSDAARLVDPRGLPSTPCLGVRLEDAPDRGERAGALYVAPSCPDALRGPLAETLRVCGLNHRALCALRLDAYEEALGAAGDVVGQLGAVDGRLRGMWTARRAALGPLAERWLAALPGDRGS